ncbi:MAG TPA: di-heme oxidoredictase family protein [Candidatus Dormibacteraeota bacterium]|nr:di-heme oxidoredictase family protein [Candidatus Dormibacteraeota bacterium]
MKTHIKLAMIMALATPLLSCGLAQAQLVDNTQGTSTARAGINKSLQQEIGAGRGDVMTPDSAIYIIKRDPFRSIRRGRQLFQRKFTRAQGQGPNEGDGTGDLNTTPSIGAGLADSCALCHGRPRGAAGSGGVLDTRPDGRHVPHLFGLGLREMLGDEITTDLRNTRSAAVAWAQRTHRPVTLPLISKGIHFGFITGLPDGSVDTSRVSGVDPDLRVKPFNAQGSMFSIRQFIVDGLHNEMGLEDSNDPDILAASQGARVVTPSGMVLDGSLDKISPPPLPDAQNGNEIDPAIVDHLEFYLLNYFKPGHSQQNETTELGRRVFSRIGCASCHIANLVVNHDRRVADVETDYEPSKGVFNGLFATATLLYVEKTDAPGLPTLKLPAGKAFIVRDIFADFKRHDLGPAFYERNWDGTIQKEFMTRPLWGVASVGPWGHDGRSVTLDDVILRHGGEAQASRDAYATLPTFQSQALQAFLNSLVLFPPDDTASNLDPADSTKPNFPQVGHGSIKLTVLFNDPTDPE